MNINFSINIDDRIINFCKSAFTKKKMALTLGITIFATSLIVYGATVVEVPNEFFPGDTISSSQVNQNFQTLQNKVNELIAEINAINTEKILPGTVVPFAGTSDKINPPDGWVLCDGRELNREGTYADLYDKISISYGEGDGTTTFRVPDLRGMFVRGANTVTNGTGERTDGYKDPDFASRIWEDDDSNNTEGIGSYQGSAFESHNHSYSINQYPYGRYLDNAAQQGALGGSFTTLTSANTGQSETRPSNVAFHYIIKY